MREKIRCRLVLARMVGDTEPAIVAAIDETIWEHWNDDDGASWMRRAREMWGIDYDTEFKVVWAEFAPQALVDAFGTPTVEGSVAE